MHFDFDIDYVLENDKVLLRPLTSTDKRHLLQFSVLEPEIWKYSLLTGAGAAQLEHYIAVAEKGREQKKEYPFIVFDKLKGTYAGSTRFYDIQPEYKTLQLGYTWYGKDFQGTGVNKNCKYLLFEFAFETLDFERVELRADNDNARSIAAMKSIGCKVDGILRSNMPKPEGTGRRDSIVLSVLKNEWLGGVKDQLKGRL